MAISMEHYEDLTTDHWMDLVNLVNVLNFGEHLCFLSVEGWFTLADLGIKKKDGRGQTLSQGHGESEMSGMQYHLLYSTIHWHKVFPV